MSSYVLRQCNVCFFTDDTSYYDEPFLWVIHDVPVIIYGVVVEILTTRCDGFSECWGNKDEENCGFSTSFTAAMGSF